MMVIMAVEKPAWMEACRHEEVFCNLLDSFPERLTILAVEKAALELGLSRATISGGSIAEA
jgi:hypothetical protein